MNTRIDINEVRKMNERRAEINQLPFASITWVDGDKEIEVTPEIREEWQFIGLSNCCFVEMEFYNGELGQVERWERNSEGVLEKVPA